MKSIKKYYTYIANDVLKNNIKPYFKKYAKSYSKNSDGPGIKEGFTISIKFKDSIKTKHWFDNTYIINNIPLEDGTIIDLVKLQNKIQNKIRRNYYFKKVAHSILFKCRLNRTGIVLNFNVYDFLEDSHYRKIDKKILKDKLTEVLR